MRGRNAPAIAGAKDFLCLELGAGNWRQALLQQVLIPPAAILAAFLAVTGAARAGDSPAQPPSTEELLRKVEMLEKRIRVLEGHDKETAARRPDLADKPPKKNAKADKAKPDSKTAEPASLQASLAEPAPPPATKNQDIFGALPSPLPGLKLGAYGELIVGARQNPAANGQWQEGFDAARFTLLPTYQFNDNIVFNAEIEFEHGGSGFDNDDKLHGTAEIEQAYVDFLVSPHFNFRAPGVDLIPIGYINLHHEPTLFYSVERPELANGLIPTTWYAPATSVYGTVVDGLRYQIQLSQSLEDFGDDFAHRTDGNAVIPFPAGYAPGISGLDALGFAHAPIGDFRQLNNSIAVTGRLEYTPPFLPGFAGSTSFYFSPNTTPRGAYADTGAPLGRSSLAIFDTEFRYRIPATGFELRAEYTQVWIGNPANMRANNDGDPTDNVGKTLWGASGEIAYHFPLVAMLGSNWDAVPFYRYTYENFQTAGFAGTDVNAPMGAGQMQFHTVGIALFPTPELVLKVNYQKVLNNAPGGAQSDSVLAGVGFFF